MPAIDVHSKTSALRTGKEYREVHEFVDAPGKKDERHDIKKIFEFGEMIRDDDLALLRKAGVAEEDVDHSLKVAQKALDIARRTGASVDMEFVGRAALFHDLGKAQTPHAIEHGKQGAEAGKKLGLPDHITAVMEKHIRGGLTEAEARELGLPVKDYSLKVLEERIIIYADRLVDIIMDGVVKTEPEAEERFEEILSTNPRYGKNEATLQRYLGYHREIQGLIKKEKSNER
jgi:uncharacterized protein